MRPIFRPSMRVKVACPSRVGCGTLAGRTKSGFSSAAEGLYDFDLFALGSVLRGLGNELAPRSEEHTSELQSQSNLVCRLLLEKKKKLRSLTQSPTLPSIPTATA